MDYAYVQLLSHCRRYASIHNEAAKRMIVTEAELERTIPTRRNKHVVFTMGSFDILHVGHLEQLEWCSRQGDFLVVGVNNDAGIARRKGPGRPIVAERDRLRIIGALRVVNVAVLTESITGVPHEESIITASKCQPDTIVLGPDWGHAELPHWKKAFPGTRILIRPYSHAVRITTTDLVADILKKNKHG